MGRGALFTKAKVAVAEAGADDKDLAFYFVHWLTDLSGAEAAPLAGATKFTVKRATAATRSSDSNATPLNERSMCLEELIGCRPTDGEVDARSGAGFRTRSSSRSSSRLALSRSSRSRRRPRSWRSSSWVRGRATC